MGHAQIGFDERLDSVNLSAVDVESDGISELWLTGADTDGAGQCHTLLRLDAGGLSPIAERQCEVGFACIAIDGAVQPVFYERDGLTLTAHLADGTELGTHTYTSDDEIPFSLFDLTC